MASEWDDLYDFACSLYDENLKLEKHHARVGKKISKLLEKIEDNLENQKHGIKPSTNDIVREIFIQKYTDLKKGLAHIRNEQELGITPVGFEGLE